MEIIHQTTVSVPFDCLRFNKATPIAERTYAYSSLPRPLEQFFTRTEYYTTPAGVRLWEKKKKRHLEKLSLHRSGKENGMCQFTTNTSNRHTFYLHFLVCYCSSSIQAPCFSLLNLNVLFFFWHFHVMLFYLFHFIYCFYLNLCVCTSNMFGW